MINLFACVSSFPLLNKTEDCASRDSLFRHRFNFVNGKLGHCPLKKANYSFTKNFSGIFDIKSRPDNRVIPLAASLALPYLRKNPLAALLLVCCLCCPGCVKEKKLHSVPANTSAASESIKILTNGNLDIKNNQEVNNTLYIEAVDSQGKPIQLPGEIAREVTARRFLIVSNPREAAYILHIDILQEGPASLQIVSQLVNSGFGSLARLSGTGGTALLADALLVKRRVPEEKQEKTTNLVNISGRNTLESAKMRIGILIAGDNENTAKIHDELGDCLTQELRKAL